MAYMNAITRFPFSETFNEKLCVLPNDDESQYEAFQSIFTKIMGGEKYIPQYPDPDYPDHPYPDTPYQILCRNNDIQLKKSKVPLKQHTSQKIIRFSPPTNGSTHFIAFVDGKEYNPYEYYQSDDTQGYCQMFAFFLVLGDIDGFKNIDQTTQIDKDNFMKLVHNNQLCIQKAFKYLELDAEAFASFKEYFERWYCKKTDLVNEWREEAGIKPDTTVKRYIHDFKRINNDLNFIKAYVYEQPLKGYNNDGGIKKRSELWFLPHKPVKRSTKMSIKLNKRIRSNNNINNNNNNNINNNSNKHTRKTRKIDHK